MLPVAQAFGKVMGEHVDWDQALTARTVWGWCRSANSILVVPSMSHIKVASPRSLCCLVSAVISNAFG